MQSNDARVRDVFDKVVLNEHLSVENQKNLVWELCHGDEELAGDVLILIGADRKVNNRTFLNWSSSRPNSEKTNASHAKFIGNFRLLEMIGSGATGLVYRAESNDHIKQQVAIKVLRYPHRHDQESLKRFELEKKALARLSHPNIAKLIGHGSTEDGAPYLVMEFVDGERIDQRIRRLPAGRKEKVSWFLQIAKTIMVAHENGILHRDLKPANLLLTKDNRVVITDFGIAKLFDEDNSHQSNLSLTGGIVGTPGFMAPEQISGNGPVTTAADVFGLGSVLYFLITGKSPVQPGPLSRMLAAIEGHNIQKPSRLKSSITADLDVICMKCLEMDPLTGIDLRHNWLTRLKDTLMESPYRREKQVSWRALPAGAKGIDRLQQHYSH